MCDIEFIIQPLCEKSPCQNNGTCRVSANSKVYECECLDGFQDLSEGPQQSWADQQIVRAMPRLQARYDLVFQA